jgi:hypothetical protein
MFEGRRGSILKTKTVNKTLGRSLLLKLRFLQLKIRYIQVVLGIALLGLLGFLSSPLWLRYLPDSLVYSKEFREARKAVKRIDDFYRAKSVLPADLCLLDLQCDESAPIQYTPTETGYELSFSTATHGFFSCLVYESVSGKWHISQ